MSRAVWALMVAALGLLVACRPAPVEGPPGPEEPAADCPSAPPAMTVAGASRYLARNAREVRANQMARIEGLGQQGFATLHFPELALLEAALASPAEAQRLDPAWVQGHLLRLYVDVTAPRPVEGLDGDVRRVVLSVAGGSQVSATYMTARKESTGWSYRFYFDPLALEGEQERLKLIFSLGLAGRADRPATAQWRLSRSAFERLDTLPLIYLLSRLREVRRARWDLLSGDREGAKKRLEDVLACAPDLTRARTLLDALSNPATPAAAQSLAVGSGSSQARALLGDPVRALSLRGALLHRLTPLCPAVISGAAMGQAQQALRRGVAALAASDPGWALPPAIVDFDRVINKALQEALDGKQPATSPSAPGPLTLSGGPAIPAQEVDETLRRWIVQANYRLVPRWVKVPKGGVREAALLELRPVLRGEGDHREVWAKLHQRLGWGWLHPGVPAQRYRVSYADHSGRHWRQQAEAAKTPAAFKALARRLLGREMLGSGDPEVMALAMAGLAQLDGHKAIPVLLKHVKAATPSRGGAALRALSLLRSDAVSSAIKAAVSSARPELRAGAMQALGSRGLAAERGLLRTGLTDADPRVSRAALVALLRSKDPVGIDKVKAWLADPARQTRALALAADPRYAQPAMGGAVSRLAAGIPASQPPPPELAPALLQTLGERAALRALSQLYDRGGAWREAVIVAVEGQLFEGLLKRAAKEESVVLRRAAVLKLARLRRPNEALLQAALQDKDPQVQLAAHVGLARLGKTNSLLALGAGARGSCAQRAIVIPTLCRSMDARSRRRMLVDALGSECYDLMPTLWELALQYQPQDEALIRAALGHTRRKIRVMGALVALGLRTGAARGKLP